MWKVFQYEQSFVIYVKAYSDHEEYYTGILVEEKQSSCNFKTNTRLHISFISTKLYY